MRIVTKESPWTTGFTGGRANSHHHYGKALIPFEIRVYISYWANRFRILEKEAAMAKVVRIDDFKQGKNKGGARRATCDFHSVFRQDRRTDPRHCRNAPYHEATRRARPIPSRGGRTRREKHVARNGERSIPNEPAQTCFVKDFQ